MYFIPNYAPMENANYSSPGALFGGYSNAKSEIESSVIGIQELGASVPEGRQFGSFIKTAQGLIWKGVSKLELSTSMGGGQESVGAEAYGNEARQALRELAKANNVEIISIHAPPNLGNASGFNPQEKGFNDDYRKIQLEEIKKAIDFSGDTGGGAVVMHTGEFLRDMSDQEWAKNPDGSYRFLGYTEEPGRAVRYMVDDRTGRLITEFRKNQVVREPRFKTKFNPDQKRYQWVDKDENFLEENNVDDLFRRVPEWNSEKTQFETNAMTWEDFEKRAEEWNKHYPRKDREWTPEDMMFRSQMDTRILQAKGSSLYHAQDYDKIKRSREKLVEELKMWEKIEDETPPEKRWNLKRPVDSDHARHYSQGIIGSEHKLPSEIIKDGIKDIDMRMKYIHEASASADANAAETELTMRHVVPIEHFAKKQTSRTYAEAGIYAMEKTKVNPHTKRDIFVAPENIFPEMGYGSHPTELIELVKNARKEMVNLLTKKKIPDPHEVRDVEGHLKLVDNPFFRRDVSEDEAKKYADKHIKATWDTQHLAMWYKHFQPLPGESQKDTKNRFDRWYMEQVDEMQKAGIIGHIHAVDAIGAGHHHLPIGQGDIPIREALEFLKKKGYKGTMISEGYGEDTMHGAGRQMTESWKGLGANIQTGYGHGSSARWGDVQFSYFGQTQNPYFIFGAYSPSNDWQLWSQVPME